MDNLDTDGFGKVFRLIHDPFLVRLRYLVAFNRYDSRGADPLYVSACNPGEHIIHADACHALGIFNAAPDRFNRLFHVHDKTASEAL